MKTKKLLIVVSSMLLSMLSAFGQDKSITTIEAALDAALKHETIAGKAESMKLYTCMATLAPSRSNFSFTFTDGGKLLHSVSVSDKGKLYYSSRDRGSFKLFTDLDISKLPAPKDLFVEGIVDKAKAALNALKFTPVDGKMYMNYNLSNNYKAKDVAIHRWSVSLPTGDGTSGKTVGFENGEVATINNSSIKK